MANEKEQKNIPAKEPLVDVTGARIDASKYTGNKANPVELAEQLAKTFGMKAKISNNAYGELEIDLTLGKYNNRPDLNKYFAETANIHNYKKKPIYDIQYAIEQQTPNLVGLYPFINRTAGPLTTIKLSVESINAFNEDSKDKNAFFKRLKEVAKGEVMTAISSAKTTIDAFEAKNESILKLEQAYQASQDYTNVPKDPQEATRCVPACSDQWRKSKAVAR